MRLQIFLRVAARQHGGHIDLDPSGHLNRLDQLVGVVALQRVLLAGIGRRIGQLIERRGKGLHRFVGGVAATVDGQRIRQVREQHLDRPPLAFAQFIDFFDRACRLSFNTGL